MGDRRTIWHKTRGKMTVDVLNETPEALTVRVLKTNDARIARDISDGGKSERVFKKPMLVGEDEFVRSKAKGPTSGGLDKDALLLTLLSQQPALPPSRLDRLLYPITAFLAGGILGYALGIAG